MGTSTGIGIVGCGYASDLYVNTIGEYPSLRLVAAYDSDADRARRLGARYGVPSVKSLDQLLQHEDISLVVNLTNPASHVEVTTAALNAGKHVYSEKPLAPTFEEGRALVDLAEERQLALACAPANILGEALQTVWREIRRGSIGTPKLVYAQLDDGAVHMENYQDWMNGFGVPWPYRDEFVTGCAAEHTSYHLQPLTSMLGPVTKVVSDAATVYPDKLPMGEAGPVAPDYVVASLTFESGAIARLTCSIVAPHDHSLLIVGDEGAIRLNDCWDFGSPVTLRGLVGSRGKRLGKAKPVPLARPYRHAGTYDADHWMEFPRGVAETASAVTEKRPCRLGAEQTLHVLEIGVAIAAGPGAAMITSRFAPPRPEPWAE